jgi:hypothetical protein
MQNLPPDQKPAGVDPATVPDPAPGALAIKDLYGTNDQAFPNLEELLAPAGSPMPAPGRPALRNRFLRNWPIEFDWGCGISSFQAAVTWRENRDAPRRLAVNTPVAILNTLRDRPDGCVTVTWLTPASATHPVYQNLGAPPSQPGHPHNVGYRLEPDTSAQRFGLWMVGQKWSYYDNGDLSWAPTDPAAWPWPAPFAWSGGKVITVQPAWVDGGVVDPGAANVPADLAY